MKINLAEAKQQYFKILISLSRSNRRTNEKTKLYFFIDESAPIRKLYATTSNRQKILLSTTNQFNWWISVEHTHYESLSQFTAYFANSNPYTSDFSDQLISTLFRLQDE